MNVSLTEELERRVEERVRSGLYTSASEVVREALRLFFQFEEARSREIALLNHKISEGLARLDRGESLSDSDARRETLARRARRIRAEG